MGGHDFERVDLVVGGYVIVCECGWRTGTSDSAEEIGLQWDEHREVVGATR